MSIKAAIEAQDRATPGKWVIWETLREKGSDYNIGTEIQHQRADEYPDMVCGDVDGVFNATLIAAAPQMAALIKRMVPWIEGLRRSSIRRRDDHIFANNEKLADEYARDIAELDAILKEANE